MRSPRLRPPHAQYTVVPGQHLAAAMMARLAEEMMSLDTDISDTDAMIAERFSLTPANSSRHPRDMSAFDSCLSPRPRGAWPPCRAVQDASAATSNVPG